MGGPEIGAAHKSQKVGGPRPNRFRRQWLQCFASVWNTGAGCAVRPQARLSRPVVVQSLLDGQQDRVFTCLPCMFTASIIWTVSYRYTHTHPFNGPLSATTRVSRYQKGKTNLDFTEARDSEWQWHQLGHMQVCTSLQTDNHASTSPLSFTDRMPFLPPNQQRQGTEGAFFLR